MQNRREFLRKALKIGAVAGAMGVAATSALASSAKSQSEQSSGVARRKAKKKEVLYYKSRMGEQYYKIAY